MKIEKRKKKRKKVVASVIPLLVTLIAIWTCWTLDVVCSGPTFWGSQGICQKWCFWVLQLWWTDWIFGRKWRFWLCWLFPCRQGLPQLHRMPREGWWGISRSKGEIYLHLYVDACVVCYTKLCDHHSWRTLFINWARLNMYLLPSPEFSWLFWMSNSHVTHPSSKCN